MNYLSVEGLTKSYDEKQLFENISFGLDQGQKAALVGVNGVGKSTLLKAASGVLTRSGQGQVQEGVIRVQGHESQRLSHARWAEEVVYLPSEIQVHFPVRVEDWIRLGATPLRRKASEVARALEVALKEWELEDLRNRLVSQLSGGEQQRVNLARAHVQGGKVWLLDEALSKVDLHHQYSIKERLRRWVRDRGYSVVIVSHDLHWLKGLVDDFVLMDQGQLVFQGSAREMLQSQELPRIFPGVPSTEWNGLFEMPPTDSSP